MTNSEEQQNQEIPLLSNTISDNNTQNQRDYENRLSMSKKWFRYLSIFVGLIVLAILLIFVILFVRGRFTSNVAHQSNRFLFNVSTQSTTTIVTQERARKVLFIIGDGIPVDVIERLPMVNLRKIQHMGQFTRAYVGGDIGTYTETPTVSAPGYMDLITGTWMNKHNVSNNEDLYPNYHYKNIFRLLKEQKPEKKIGIFSTWIENRIKLVGEGLKNAGDITFDYKFDGYELDNVTYLYDPNSFYIHRIDERVTNETEICIQNFGPDLSWVYLQYTDDVGHLFGDSEQFDQAVLNFDNQIGRIWKAIDYRIKHYREDWLFIITTDHGRDPITGKEHGNQTKRERTTWIVTNIYQTNTYFADYECAIVDILPMIARFMNLTIPLDTERELDGIPLIGKVSIIKPNASLLGDTLKMTWKSLDHEGNVTIWLSTTNLFKYGLKDNYTCVGSVPIDNQMTIIDVKKYPSKFYKIVLEGQYNKVNRWVFR